MANTFAPFGFRQFGTLEGNTPTMGLTRRYLASSDTSLYFTGDVVILSTGATSSPLGFISQPSSGVTTGPPILGIFNGCEVFNTTVGRTVFAPTFSGNIGSSSVCNAYIIEGEDNLFIAQCNSTSVVVGTSVIGFNIGFTTGQTGSSQSGGNATTGISNIALVSTSVSASGGSSLPFRIVDTTSNYFPPGTNGADGTTPGAVLVVAFNNSMRRSLTALST